MKKMVIVVAMLCMWLCGQMAYAEVNTAGLTEEQKAELALQAAKMKNNTNPSFTPEKANEWVRVGENVGLALIGAADKLGQSADKFLDSKTGKITLVLIVWKMMGSMMVHVILGVSFWIIVTVILGVIFKRSSIESVERTAVSGSFWRTKKVNYYNPKACEDERSVIVALWILATIVSFITIFSY